MILYFKPTVLLQVLRQRWIFEDRDDFAGHIFNVQKSTFKAWVKTSLTPSFADENRDAAAHGFKGAIPNGSDRLGIVEISK